MFLAQFVGSNHTCQPFDSSIPNIDIPAEECYILVRTREPVLAERIRMNPISFITANYVGRELGFHVTEGWMQGDRATNAYFAPIETFEGRFDALLSQIKALGFDTIDLWVAQLHWSWATAEHIALARAALARHGMRITSLAGGFGATADELTAACRLALALDAPILAGSSPFLKHDRATAIAILQQHGVRLALENHPDEKTPADILRMIGTDGGGALGTAVDTGWWGTNGYDAAEAIRELRPHIITVHLKDVLAVGEHLTCVYGQGIVPIEQCVRLLRETGYSGVLGIEHEPFIAPHSYDPSAECARMLQMLRGWLR